MADRRSNKGIGPEGNMDSRYTSSEGEGRPVCLGTVRQEVMEIERQASLPPHPHPQESWKVQTEKCAFHFKKNGKSLEGFYPGRCMI